MFERQPTPGRFAPWLQILTKEFNFPLRPSPLWYLSSPPLLRCLSSIVNVVIFFIHCCPRHNCCARVLDEWAKSNLYINYLQTARLSPPLNHKVPVLQKEKPDWGSEDCCWVEENNLLMPEQPESYCLWCGPVWLHFQDVQKPRERNRRQQNIQAYTQVTKVGNWEDESFQTGGFPGSYGKHLKLLKTGL